jgi:hypothetical protein
MYRCEVCGRVVEAGKTAIKRVVATREREYPSRQSSGARQPKSSGRNQRKKGDPGGTGQEIVREQLVCADCSGPFDPP